jgi:hypothetical protein
MLAAALAAAGALSAAQPANEIEGDGGSWWGASVWVVITLVLLAGMFFWKGISHPNRP